MRVIGILATLGIICALAIAGQTIGQEDCRPCDRLAPLAPPSLDLANINPRPIPNDANIVSGVSLAGGAYLDYPTNQQRGYQQQGQYGQCSCRSQGSCRSNAQAFWCGGPARRVVSFPFRRTRCR